MSTSSLRQRKHPNAAGIITLGMFPTLNHAQRAIKIWVGEIPPSITLSLIVTPALTKNRKKRGKYTEKRKEESIMKKEYPEEILYS